MIENSQIDKMIISNTIPMKKDAGLISKKIEVISIGTLLAEVIRRIDMNVSLTEVIII